MKNNADLLPKMYRKKKQAIFSNPVSRRKSAGSFNKTLTSPNVLFQSYSVRQNKNSSLLILHERPFYKYEYNSACKTNQITL